ncbi:MAG: bifunctional DNA-formamidopyrimidine glycosylase/DNA-(apurinic or apyrimidinic site) lyase [Rubritalea sp.]|uniref:bifunctional DNA-formamidopyrimidine glycosylase/DNA-(apurinic or apyrimidinic site) lyase n=1 Tax=Rubritalea sp. TaxID=2109375 RepID=UPI003241D9A8
MPELPEVETTCRGVRPHIDGQTITHIDVHNGSLRWPVSDGIYALRDSLVHSVTRRAKYILIGLEGDRHILLHLGMSGSLRISTSDEELRKHDHLVFYLSNGLEMRLHDPRRFGCALWFEGDYEKHPLLAKLGPEPLSDSFTLPQFLQSCAKRDRAIKLHIMDNTTVVGVGNIYACEALQLSGINPKRAANKVSKLRLRKLYEAIRLVLARSIEQGGTTLKDFLHSDGQPGYFKQQLAVYGREGKACLNCGMTIKRITLGQRSTFYCPKCQR